MPFRNVTELTEQGWITARRAVRPPGEKPLMTHAELDNFQRNIQYEWEVRKKSKSAILAIIAEGVEPQQILAMIEEEAEPQETEVPEPLNVQPPVIPPPVQEPEPLNARPPMTPPPAHLLQGSARQGNYYTQPDDQYRDV